MVKNDVRTDKRSRCGVIVMDFSFDGLFDDDERYPIWKPGKVGEMIAGTLLSAKNKGRYDDSLLITVEVYFTEQSELKPHEKWSHWTGKQLRGTLADLSGVSYDENDFQSIVLSIKAMSGKGIAIKYLGQVEGKNNPYAKYAVRLVPQFDKKPENKPVPNFFEDS